MKTQALVFLVIGLLAGIGGTAFAMKRMEASTTQPTVTTMTNSTADTMPGMDMSAATPSVASPSMADMTAGLKGKMGDDFDKTFLSEMIAHHQGAIDMATLAAGRAKHQEVKDLANGILSAQTSEIAQMRQWQKSWGYAQ